MMDLRRAAIATIPLAGMFIAASVVHQPGNDNGEYPAEAVSREYGVAARLGNGEVRTYVEVDRLTGIPVELGIALDSAALAGLPTGPDPTMFHLALPADAPAPYRFAMFHWNPQGHEPASIYTVPHFDFHFYVVPHQEVDMILPERPDFEAKANRLPGGDFVPEHYIPFTEPGQAPASVAVPQMGVHWLDLRSPEIQTVLGKPDGYLPFTRTFIYGSWDGRFTFVEPMITLEHLLSRPDEVILIPRPKKVDAEGWYPGAYRITYDERSGEYRVGLTSLVKMR